MPRPTSVLSRRCALTAGKRIAESTQEATGSTSLLPYHLPRHLFKELYIVVLLA